MVLEELTVRAWYPALIPLSRWSPGRSPGWFTGWHPGDIPFTLVRGLPGEFLSSALVQRKYVYIIYGACIQSPRAPELSWKKRKHSIGIWRMHIHFARFVLWRNNDRPDFTREFNRDAFHAATSPGCTREFTRDDSRVTFPKSLAAFYPAFHPRDLSRCVKGVLEYLKSNLNEV